MARPVRSFVNLKTDTFSVASSAVDKEGNEISENTGENKAVYYPVTCKCGYKQRLVKWRLAQGHICKICGAVWWAAAQRTSQDKASYLLTTGTGIYKGTVQALAEGLKLEIIQAAMQHGFTVHKFGGLTGFDVDAGAVQFAFQARLAREGITVLKSQAGRVERGVRPVPTPEPQPTPPPQEPEQPTPEPTLEEYNPQFDDFLDRFTG